MKVLHVAPSFHPAHIYGGPIESVYQLCRALARRGCQVRVLTTDANGPKSVLAVDTTRELEIAGGFSVRYCHRIVDVSISPALLRLLLERIRWADVVHLMAVYSFPTIPTLLLCKLLGKPVVWSPRGMLQRWAGTRKPRLKALWEMVCRLAAPKKLILHVTSQQEADESAGRFPSAALAIIANGVEIPSIINQRQPGDDLRLVYLGRLDAKKGIENLIQACAIVKARAEQKFSLTIAGAGDAAYERALAERIATLGLTDQIRMIGAVHGPAKQALFASAAMIVVPSHTENFAMVVAEALAHGVPVIASKGTPWQAVEEQRCGLWVDNDPTSLADAIARLSQMPLEEMGRRGRAWMEKDFSWDGRAEEMIRVYQAIMQTAAKLASQPTVAT